MGELQLSGLFIYPVKSLAGISLQDARVDRFGLEFDRRWMLVDRRGEFLSQRRLPRMALIRQRLCDRELILRAHGLADLRLPLHPPEREPIRVRIWGDSCMVRSCGAEADAWLSGFLGQACRLVHMPDTGYRGVDPDYARATDQIAFADGFPLLLVSEASLQELNQRLQQPVPMSRFRPNLVVRGCESFAEDGWSLVRIGDMAFHPVKPCSRCKITTVDPETALVGTEPLKTLAGYRRRGQQVFFGQNLVHDGRGRLRLGMRVDVERAGNG